MHGYGQLREEDLEGKRYRLRRYVTGCSSSSYHTQPMMCIFVKRRSGWAFGTHCAQQQQQ